MDVYYFINRAGYRLDEATYLVAIEGDSSISVGSDGCLHDGVRWWYVSAYFPFSRNRRPVWSSCDRTYHLESRSSNGHSPFVCFSTTENATEERTEASTPAQPNSNAASETTNVSKHI